jgi:hypothetical protein
MEIRGLECPSCGGTVKVAEGAPIAACTSCGIGLLVQGDRGDLTYAVRLKAGRDQVLQGLAAWWRGPSKAKDLESVARVMDAFPVFVPVWRVTGQVVGWIFGDEEREESGRKITTPIERRIATESDMNHAACELGELGIRSVELQSGVLEPFDEEKVEKQGMIFRPLTPAREVRELATKQFLEGARNSVTGLKVLKQAALKVVGLSQSLVYYPLWVVRYDYRGRMYQATADGSSGRLLYARGPGNDAYRASIFVFGTAAGAFVLTTVLRNLNDAPLLVTLAVSFGLAYWGYRTFRYGGEVTLEEGGWDVTRVARAVKELGNS